MRLTVDSKDPLAEVLAVVGSMYGVALQVAETAPATETTPAETAPVGPTAVPDQPAAEKPAPRSARAADRSRRTAAAATARAPRASARAKRGATVDSATVRAWARASGHQVSDRGRLSSSLIDAYREANG